MNRRFLPILAWAIMCPLSVLAQADEREEIVTLTEQIRKEPASVSLYLRRGDLYRSIQNWDASQADFDQARALDSKIEEIDFLKGRLFQEANWPLSARVALDRFLTKHTNHVDALIARARVLSKLGHRVAAAQDYTRALRLASQPQPELYLERAQTLAAAGPPHVADALRSLDEGTNKLGPLVTLQLAAIDLELGQKRYDAALARGEAMAATSPRKETWLARKGEILRQAGRDAEARIAFTDALRAIETLPPARKNVPAVVALQTRIRDQLEALK